MTNYRDWNCKEQGVVLKSGNNIQNTQALFYEFSNPDATYTLKNEDYEKDGKVYVSAYQIFINSIDESEAALKIVGSYQHWRKLLGLKWFREGMPHMSFDGIDMWRQDMENRDKTLAKKQLLEAAESGNVTAQRIMYGTPSSPKKRGRKTKETEDQSSDFNPVAELSRLRKGQT